MIDGYNAILLIDHIGELLFALVACAFLFFGYKMFNKILQHNKEIATLKAESEKSAMVEFSNNISNGLTKSSNIIASGIIESISGAINTFGKDYIIATKTMNTSLTDHMNALNQLISTEFYNAILLPRAGKKDKPPIDDIKATTDMIAERILSGLQPEFFAIFQVHGISEEFIMSYITRELFAKLIEFTRVNRKKEVI